MTILLTLSLLFIPVSAYAQDSMTMRDHAVIRGVERLERLDYFGLRQSYIRLGHNVRTRRMSPRRVVPQNEAVVLDVIDGSVLLVQLGNGEFETVRTLGAEVPLLVTGTDLAQCHAEEAKFALSHWLLGKTVALERDRNYQRDFDGRLLRYIRVGSLQMNGWMIENGYSFAEDRNQHQRWGDYQQRETDAREAERGLWSYKCDYHPNPIMQLEVLE